MSFMFYIPLSDPNPRAQKLLRIFEEKLHQQQQQDDKLERLLLENRNPDLSSMPQPRSGYFQTLTKIPRYCTLDVDADMLQEIKDHAHIIHDRSSVKPAVPQDSCSPSYAQTHVDGSYHNPCMCACHGSLRAISPKQQHPTSNEDSSEQVQPSSPSQPPISEHSEVQLRKEEEHRIVSNPIISPRRHQHRRHQHRRHQHRRQARDHSQQSIPSRMTRSMKRLAIRQTRQSEGQEN
ncbi:hypothetical protein F4804DRAFT_327740 [Jackrogersella minutella]|nr:hypothetical protein F4804DRAFT_327740 [Jackrogersella minutella]